MQKALGMTLLLATASLTGCGTGIVVSVPLEPSERPSLATSLEQVLPVLAADHVELWQSQPCRALETPDGEFRDPEPPLGCGPYVFLGEPKRFDDNATAVFDRVSKSFQSAGAKAPEYGWFYYAGDELTRAIFFYGPADTEACMQQTLVWDASGASGPGEDMPGETTMPIADHWEYGEHRCD